MPPRPPTTPQNTDDARTKHPNTDRPCKSYERKSFVTTQYAAPYTGDCSTSTLTLLTLSQSGLKTDTRKESPVTFDALSCIYPVTSNRSSLANSLVCSHPHGHCNVPSWSETPKRPAPIPISDNHRATRDTLFSQLGANAARLFRQPGDSSSLIKQHRDMRVRVLQAQAKNELRACGMSTSEADIGLGFIV